jgi:mono/diheme cytochrome c family protein
MLWRKIAAIFCLLTVASVAIFCSKSAERHAAPHSSAEHAPADWKFTLPPGDPVAGKDLFVELECYKCHEIKGENFPIESDKGIGPELSQMAGMHPAEFFAESIVNPNAVLDAEDREKGFLGADGKSRMPTYSEVLTVKQLADLAAYLKSLSHVNPGNHRH